MIELPDTAPSPIAPRPDNFVCAQCASAEIECLDWVRVNDSAFIGGNQCPPADEYWCSACEIHEKPTIAQAFCEEHGHRGFPCTVCGAQP